MSNVMLLLMGNGDRGGKDAPDEAGYHHAARSFIREGAQYALSTGWLVA